MTKRSMRQMYLDMLEGIEPDFLLQYSYGRNPYSQRDPLTMGYSPSIVRSREGGKDIWGVHYVANRESGFAFIPEPGNFILDDITKWRDVIKAPDLSGVDLSSRRRRIWNGSPEWGWTGPNPP